jgi:predicted methyltransferase
MRGWLRHRPGRDEFESTMFANKDDPYPIKVFDPPIKGETDRFA